VTQYRGSSSDVVRETMVDAPEARDRAGVRDGDHCENVPGVTKI
jgi:hypothetical protein